ncbi:hypothetical protein BJV77DRAFT_1145142 [Russula vinacea]|nr:hypothetical protein BJV77DRAFT_1145142 [Russula vinacea]
MDDKETYLLLVLSDSNLPTGSFVASAGLESTATHALFHATELALALAQLAYVTPTSSILAFLRNSIDTYARSALPFSRDAHRITTAYTNANGDIRQQLDLDGALEALGRIDALYDACTLNHVARRASCAQGVALLTLYARGFTCPPFLALATPQGVDDLDEQERDREYRGAHLHLFLHARGVLSAAQLLLHAVKPLLDEALSSTAHLVSGALREGEEEIHPELAAEQLPATTWPLGEILSTRHDLLHSRIFNS